MAGENTTLKVTIIGDSKSAQRAVSGLSGKTQSLSGKLAGFGGVVAKGFMGAGLVVGGLGIAAGKMGLEVAAGNEQAKIAFTTMLGSGKKAERFLKDLQAFAAATPFEFPELQTAASSLVSAGINADKVIPIMRTLGDVTSGMGTGAEGVKRATIAIQQMNAAGKISGEDLNQLRDAGIPVYDLLSKATGKSKAEVVKLAQAGKLGQKELGQMMKALESGKGLERFSGLMEKQATSLTGLWSTFQDTLGMGLAKAIEPLIPIIKDGLGGASNFLAGVLPRVTSGLMNVVTWVKNFIIEFQAGYGAAGMLRTVLTFLVGKLGEVWNVLSVTVGWLIRNKEVTATFVGIIGTAVAIMKVWQGVQLVLNALLAANPIGIVVVAVAALAAGLVYAWQNSATFRDVCTTAFKAVGTAVQWLWQHAVRPFIQFFLNAIGWLAGAWAVMLDLLGNVPGFGWAKDAAAKLRGAKDEVDKFNSAIDHIDPYVPVDVVTTFTYKGYKASLDTHNAGVLDRKGIRGNASGGRNLPAGWSWVGEEGPELMWLPGGSNIYSNPESKAIMGAPGGRGLAAGGVNVYVTVNGQVMSERDLAQTLTPAIRNELVKIGKRNGGNIFPK